MGTTRAKKFLDAVTNNDPLRKIVLDIMAHEILARAEGAKELDLFCVTISAEDSVIFTKALYQAAKKMAGGTTPGWFKTASAVIGFTSGRGTVAEVERYQIGYLKRTKS